MDIVYLQPLKELLQVGTYFKEEIVILVSNEIQEKKAKQSGLIPCYLVSESTKEIQKLSGKCKAVLGGSIAANEFAVKIKADYLLQPCNTKQFFDVGLAQKLADAGTTTVMMLADLIVANSFERHQYWKNYIEVARYCMKKKAKFIVASGCSDPLHLRPGKVREALAMTLGLPQNLAKQYLEEKLE